MLSGRRRGDSPLIASQAPLGLPKRGISPHSAERYLSGSAILVRPGAKPAASGTWRWPVGQQ